jgi:hypothetical protein
MGILGFPVMIWYSFTLLVSGFVTSVVALIFWAMWYRKETFSLVATQLKNKSMNGIKSLISSSSSPKSGWLARRWTSWTSDISIYDFWVTAIYVAISNSFKTIAHVYHGSWTYIHDWRQHASLKMISFGVTNPFQVHVQAKIEWHNIWDAKHQTGDPEWSSPRTQRELDRPNPENVS